MKRKGTQEKTTMLLETEIAVATDFSSKFLLKSINVICKQSDNSVVVCSLVRWNQDMLPMKN